MRILNFNQDFKGSLEEEKLIVTPLGSTNYQTVSRLKKSDLKGKENSKLKQESVDGYKFEWETWKFFYDLGPSLMSEPNHEFVFDLSEYSSKVTKAAKSAVTKAFKEDGEEIPETKLSPQNTRQEDVIAIFERHIFIIECKHSGKQKGLQDLRKKLHDFLILKPFIEKRCEKIFGEPYSAVFIAASSNFILDNKTASAFLKNNSIIIFDEKRRDYILEVLSESKSSEFALTQFLGFFRSGHADFNELVPNNGKNNSKAVQYKKEPWKISSFISDSGKGKKNKVYTFSMHPEDMLKISTVAHQQFNNIFEAEAIDANYYQRILTSTRLNKIKHHLETKNTPFANNILVSYRGSDNNLKFEEIDIIGKNSLKGNKPGILSFNACPGTFHVIDGQHRLFGYTSIEKKAGGLREKHRIIVTAFQGLTVEEEAEIFLEVNSNAKPIVASLLMEIEWSSQASTLSNLCNGIIFKFRGEQTSTLYELINEAQKANKNKLAPKNLKTAINNFESFGGKNIDKWFASKCAKNQLPDSDIIIFWSGSFQKTLQNYYSHFETLVYIFYRYNQSRWKAEKGIIRNIFFGGLLQVIDRITVSAIEDWRLNNPDVILKSYFIKGKSENEEKSIESVRQKFLAEVTDISKKKMKILAHAFEVEADDKKDKILSKDHFNLGAGAISLATTFLVKEYLNQFPDLARRKDEENFDRISNSLSAKEVKSLKAKLKKYENETAAHIKNQPKSVEKEDRIVRAGKHFDQLKNISYSLLTRTIGSGFWRGLVMKHLYKKYDEPKLVGTEYHYGNAWYTVKEVFTQHEIDYGDEAYEIPWNFVEGAVEDLIASPAKIIFADNYSWEAKVKLLKFLWEVMLIPKKGSEELEVYDWEKIISDEIDLKDKLIWGEKDNSKKKNIVKIIHSSKWRQYTDYIRLFNKIRNFDRHGKLAAEEKSPWKTHYDYFDYYEPLYIDKLEAVSEIVKTLIDEDEALTNSDEDDD